MFVKEHAPHFQVTETAAGWVIDAINREGVGRRLVGVYRTRHHAKAAATNLNKILFSRHEHISALARDIAPLRRRA